MNEYCVCGHVKKDHKNDDEGYGILLQWGEHWCQGCLAPARRAFHTFRLDNLKLIEDTAKEKGLV